MANRFPLIFNSGAGQIQELAASDNLDLTSSNLVNAGILFTSSGSATAPSLQIGSGTTYKPGLYSPGTDQLAVSTAGVQHINIEADGDINIDGGGVFYDATNNRLAIGTTGPVSALNVKKTATGTGGTAESAITLTYDTTNYGQHFMNNGGVYVIHADNNGVAGGNIKLWADNSIIFSTAGVHTEERAQIDSSGRLLVGTTTTLNANRLLQVAGLGAELIHGSADAIGPTINLSKSRTSIATPTQLSGSDVLGNVDFSGHDDLSYKVGARIHAIIDNAPGNNDLPTALVFSTTSDSASSPTERMRIKSDGDVSIVTGNLIIGTAGKGIDFSATANGSGTMTNELLSDYEEGTWTPVATSQTGSITAYTSSATYTKTGNVVCVLGTIGITTGGTAAGVLFIAGYPFTASSQGSLALAAETQLTGAAYQVRINPNTTTGFIAALAGGAAVYTNGGSYSFALTYLT